jgi:carbonic anhydrase
VSDVETLLDHNRRFAEQFEGGDLTIRPHLSTILLTCVDSRVDPAHLFELGLGDAVVLRNAGGRITPAVMGDLAILGVLAANMPGNGAMQPQLVIMHHTDCGMARLAVPAIQQQVAKRLGLSEDEVAAMAVVDPTETVQADIERLRQTPGIPDALIVTGLVYDVRKGTVDQVVPAAQLRATA